MYNKWVFEIKDEAPLTSDAWEINCMMEGAMLAWYLSPIATVNKTIAKELYRSEVSNSQIG